mmetsp:Transcript_8044/g.14344  ORF Transcript_8044/g.14344 Transcript_8044/m.14344 type:complete len:910 (+) Transcript_8044:132-2861(+)
MNATAIEKLRRQWPEDFDNALRSVAPLLPPDARRDSGSIHAVSIALHIEIRILRGEIDKDSAGTEYRLKVLSLAMVLDLLSWWSPEERDELYDIAREAAEVALRTNNDLHYMRNVATRWPEILEPSWISDAAGQLHEFVEVGATDSFRPQHAHYILQFLAAWLLAEPHRVCPDLDMDSLLAHEDSFVREKSILLYPLMPLEKQERHIDALRVSMFNDGNERSFPFAWRLYTQSLNSDLREKLCTFREAVERASAILQPFTDQAGEISWDQRKAQNDTVLSILDTYQDIDFESASRENVDTSTIVDAIRNWFENLRDVDGSIREINSWQEYFNALAWCVGVCKGILKQSWVELLIEQLNNPQQSPAFVRYAISGIESGCDWENGEVNLNAIREMVWSSKDATRTRWVGRYLPKVFLEKKVFKATVAKKTNPSNVCLLEALLTIDDPDEFIAAVPLKIPKVSDDWRSLRQRIDLRCAEHGASEAISWMGVSFDMILTLMYHPSYYSGITTAGMLNTIVKPLTVEGCSAAARALRKRRTYATWVHPMGDYGSYDRDFGANKPLASAYATEFVSHCWAYTFSMVKDMLEFGSNADFDAFYWFDLLSVDQHDAPSRPVSWWDSTFRNCVGSFGKVSLAVNEWAHPMTLSRIWCIWEIFSGLDLGSSIQVCFPWQEESEGALALLSDVSSIKALFDSLDVSTAQATFAGDRDRILEAIEASESASISLVNQQVRAFFATCLIGYAAYFGPQEAVELLLSYEPRLDIAQMIIAPKFSVPVKLPAEAALTWASEDLLDLLLDPNKVPASLLVHMLDRALLKYCRSEEPDTRRLAKCIRCIASKPGVTFTEDFLTKWLAERTYLQPTEEILAPLRTILADTPKSLTKHLSTRLARRKGRNKLKRATVPTHATESCLLQ